LTRPFDVHAMYTDVWCCLFRLASARLLRSCYTRSLTKLEILQFSWRLDSKDGKPQKARYENGFYFYFSICFLRSCVL